jgi:hypothetical protein
MGCDTYHVSWCFNGITREGETAVREVECHHTPQMQGHCHALSSASRPTKEPGAFFTGNLSSVKVLANQQIDNRNSVIY